MHYQVRPMRPGDVDGILAVQALAYPGFLLESAGFFLNRLALAPRHCWIADGAESGTLGYLISYPWDAGLPPVLDVELDALPDGADHWFLHDCAVSPAAKAWAWARRCCDRRPARPPRKACCAPAWCRYRAR